ncbi:MAG TPA: RNA degradosome polyphosphate kinase [Thermotogota bacterium]|nr:RNA degradosome polyphosphate kinase [Thermotogota bacterium]HRW91951.1 RNA degradosome polyphosphate kinase [Thermotogota bacterium]
MKNPNEPRKDKEQNLFFNRELSWLDFNFRVLEEAMDTRNPLLERIKFLAITGSNLDEFFMIRVAGLMEQVEAGYTGRDLSGRTSRQQLEEISQKVHLMVKNQYNCLVRSILPALKKEKVFFLGIKDLDPDQVESLDHYFRSTVFPVITPMAVDQGRPFPQLPNKSLNQAVYLKGPEKEELLAVVQVPSVLPRFVPVSLEEGQGYILMENVIAHFASLLFKGYHVEGMVPFRLTRNADLSIDEDDAQDLLVEIEKSLQQRRSGFPVRLEIAHKAKPRLRDALLHMLEIESGDVYEVPGPIDLSAWMKLTALPGKEALLFEHVAPRPVPALYDQPSVFDVVRDKDVLLHHPYQSFEHVLDFLKEAARDPNVLAIKQTLYRVSGNSPVVETLMEAAQNGKQVTVLVELKARFDEENNIQWARKLEKAGCYVVYGLVGLKTHCKVLLVVRREDEGIARYVHLSTGNYNDSTARLYTDIGLFTSNELFGGDASSLFNVLTGYSLPPQWKVFSVAPLGLRDRFLDLIRREAQFAREGMGARLIFKVNSLLDQTIIQELYKASQQGVQVDLIVRGICSLRPGLPGVSDNIRVVSIVGRFLEHSRVFYFENAGSPEVFLGSADMMPRNLDRRIETIFPVLDESLRNQLLGFLELQLSDTLRARQADAQGAYRFVDGRGKEAVDSQHRMIQWAKELFQQRGEEELKPLFQPARHRDEG